MYYSANLGKPADSPILRNFGENQAYSQFYPIIVIRLHTVTLPSNIFTYNVNHIHIILLI